MVNVLSRIGAIINPTAAQATSFMDAIDDRWYGPVSTPTWAGVPVTSDSALGRPTFWACHGLLTETIAALPLHVYRDRPGSGRDKVPDYWLYPLLHEQPNDTQDAFQFFEMMIGDMILRGHAYAEKILNRDGTIEQLLPLDPDLVTRERLANRAIRYRVRRPDGKTDVLNGEDVLHIPYKNGLSVVQAMRQTFGTTAAMEQYSAEHYANDASAGIVLEHPGVMSKDAQARLLAGWDARHRGVGNAHRTAVLEEGMKVAHMNLSPEDNQFVQTAEFRAEELCRTLRIPPHMVGLTSKVTSWGTGIEQMSIGFVQYTLLPWLRRCEQAFNRQLITEDDRAKGYYCSFNVEGLLRGDSAARGALYTVLRQWGVLSANDIRRLEGMNDIPNGDIYLQPLNFVEAGTESEPPADNVTPFPAAASAGDVGVQARYQAMLAESAARLIRREVAALTMAAKRSASDSAAWRRAVEEFYTDFSDVVAQTMRVEQSIARAYCVRRTNQLAGGASAFLDIEVTGQDELVALALDQANGEAE